MYHYIYKITNNINGRFYIGKRSSNVPPIEDPYMGSGVAIKGAIDKYGVDNFIKEILSTHNTPEEALLEEQSIVTEEFIERTDTYNLMTGGCGGKQSKEVCEKISKTLKGKYVGENSPNYGRKHSDEIRKRNSDSHKEYYKNNPDSHGMLGKKHTIEAKTKMSKSQKGLIRHTDDFKEMQRDNMTKNNPMANGMRDETKKKLSEAKKGLIWVTNGYETKMVSIDEFESMSDKWKRGRILK